MLFLYAAKGQIDLRLNDFWELGNAFLFHLSLSAFLHLSAFVCLSLCVCLCIYLSGCITVSKSLFLSAADLKTSICLVFT